MVTSAARTPDCSSSEASSASDSELEVEEDEDEEEEEEEDKDATAEIEVDDNVEARRETFTSEVGSAGSPCTESARRGDAVEEEEAEAGRDEEDDEDEEDEADEVPAFFFFVLVPTGLRVTSMTGRGAREAQGLRGETVGAIRPKGEVVS